MNKIIIHVHSSVIKKNPPVVAKLKVSNASQDNCFKRKSIDEVKELVEELNNLGTVEIKIAPPIKEYAHVTLVSNDKNTPPMEYEEIDDKESFSDFFQ